MGLDDQPTLELQAGADQGGQGASLAQQVGHGLGIGVTSEDFVDHRPQPDHAAAGGLVLDLEGGDEVVGVGGEFGHDETSAGAPAPGPRAIRSKACKVRLGLPR